MDASIKCIFRQIVKIETVSEDELILEIDKNQSVKVFKDLWGRILWIHMLSTLSNMCSMMTWL